MDAVSYAQIANPMRLETKTAGRLFGLHVGDWALLICGLLLTALLLLLT